MNFDTMNVKDNWGKSRAHQAVEFSKNTDFIGNNFKQVFTNKSKQHTNE